jgi:hypothetical protein
MYRMPWSLNDNPIGWLEITDVCNIYCKGCYRRNLEGHRSLDEIRQDLEFYKKWRNCDNISIAGGEPLVHPQIIEIVAMIREMGMKPLLLSNGEALIDDKPFLKELKRAGALGFTFHVDTMQYRPGGRKHQSEEEVMKFRQKLADMCYDVGGFYVSFGCTVYYQNLDTIPMVVEWAQDNIHKVHGLVFITYRAGDLNRKYTVDGEEVDARALGYTKKDADDIDIKSTDVYQRVKNTTKNYEPSGYLGGSIDHESIKWLMGVTIGNRNGDIYGSIGPRGMEMIQAGHHLLTGRYLTYMNASRMGRASLLLSLFDKDVRGALWNHLKDALKNPMRLFQPLYVQTIGIVQAPDIKDDGRQDMCDSCPDMIVWDGKLIHSCRLDELRVFGSYVQPEAYDSTIHNTLTQKVSIDDMIAFSEEAAIEHIETPVTERADKTALEKQEGDD